MTSNPTHKDDDKDFVAGLVIGGIIGAAMAIVLGSEEGREIRKKLKKKGHQLISELPDLANEAEEKIDEFKDAVAEEAREIIEPGISNLQNQGRKLIDKFFGTDRSDK
jgi:gas vesicle protein